MNTVSRTILLPFWVGRNSHHLLALERVDEIGGGPMLEAAEVMVGVIAHAMAFVQNLAVKVGIFRHVIAHHEERCLHVVATQGVQQKGRRLRNGSIVERQVNCVFVWIHSPDGVRI